MRWKPALSAFAITFGDRMPKAEQHSHENRRLHRSLALAEKLLLNVWRNLSGSS
jgi:hypothetical protein